MRSTTSTDHEGDDISVEAIATQPDTALVMDRDATAENNGEEYPANGDR